MKFYDLPTCLCKKCKGPTKVVKTLFSASDKICITVKCLHCQTTEDCILSIQDIAALYFKYETKSDSILYPCNETVQ